MKTFKELREAMYGYKMAAPKAKKEDAATDKAVKDFLAKGGKIKKLAPGKAAGYHGKDDPGKGMAGMMDKGDTKAIGTRKKVKSMEDDDTARMYKDNPEMMKKGGPGGYKSLNKAGKRAVKKAMKNEISDKTKKSYIRKAAADIDNRSYAQGIDDVKGQGNDYDGANNKRISNRLKGIRRATK